MIPSSVRLVERLERHQVALYLAALAIGAAAGLLLPGLARPAELAITPVLGLLLYATFLGIPFASAGRALRDWRFLGAVLVVNFVLVPLVVWLLSRLVAHDRAVLVGVLFVLLTPCVDYVIVFAGLAGGSRERLLAATPLLMLAQLLLLPVFLWWMAGSDIAATVEARPFVEALLWLIVLPLAAAAGTQFAAERARWVARLRDAVLGAMVPLMMLTLAVVVASQVAGIGGRIATLVIAMPVFVLFAAVMVAAGAAVSRLVGLDTAGRRAVVFSGATRNSLVVLPLVLALPPAFALAPLVVVAQTLVELVVMVALVRLMPRLIPG